MLTVIPNLQFMEHPRKDLLRDKIRVRKKGNLRQFINILGSLMFTNNSAYFTFTEYIPLQLKEIFKAAISQDYVV